MQTTSRRSFIRKSAAAGSVMTMSGLVPRVIYGDDASTGIRYRELGSTGYKVSEVSFGAMNTRDAELIHAAIDAGINYIDTAYKYMNGANEENIGRVMETKRDKVFLTTKMPDEDIPAIPERMETSLRRLKTDHVDLVLAHSLDSPDAIRNEDIMKHLDNARRKGQVRFVGFSSHSLPDEFVDAALETGFWEAILVTYNYESPSETARNIKRAREAGLGVIAMKTQMRGAGVPDAASGSVTKQQAALKWVLQNDYVDCAIPGMTSFEQLTEDLEVMKMEYSRRDDETLRRWSHDNRGSYCKGVLGCTGCEDECPYGVKVHEINRCLGYARGYGDVRLAWENYRDLPRSSRIQACDDCEECVVKCVNGIDLTENIRQARSLFA